MTRTIHKTNEPVVLEGFQCIMKPSEKYGNYSLSAIVDAEMISALEADRKECLNWAASKLKNPKRSTLKLEPWEEVSEGKYKVKFSWKEETKPPVVDAEGMPVTNVDIPLYSGSMVKVAFYQKPYIISGDTYGTSLKLVGVQVISTGGEAGVSGVEMDTESVAELFGKTEGYTAESDLVIPDGEEEDF